MVWFNGTCAFTLGKKKGGVMFHTIKKELVKKWIETVVYQLKELRNEGDKRGEGETDIFFFGIFDKVFFFSWWYASKGKVSCYQKKTFPM